MLYDPLLAYDNDAEGDMCLSKFFEVINHFLPFVHGILHAVFHDISSTSEIYTADHTNK
jgi:hypothetical protein